MSAPRAGWRSSTFPTRAARSRCRICWRGESRAGARGLPLLLPHTGEGRVRRRAVPSEPRLPELPDVPTLAEVGIDGYPAQTWMGLVAPAGTPRAIVGKLNAVVNDVLRPAALRASLAKLGFKEAPGSPDDFGRLIPTAAQQYAPL